MAYRGPRPCGGPHCDQVVQGRSVKYCQRHAEWADLRSRYRRDLRRLIKRSFAAGRPDLVEKHRAALRDLDATA
jgi:hypothetical protein